ncbi:MAG TPA: tannase/feruloyl esterase family alpha/beta hydrolase [Terracidiphilus sp.]|jgi:feruloyl esterase|nr:tannase/feruloyl esterase family alpha/beta hydrolase [Terracidiphilus sp.]
MRILPWMMVPFLLFASTVPVAAQVSAATQRSNTAQASSQGCEKLAGLAVPNASITMAREVDAGAFVAPPAPFTGNDASAFYKTLPAFCRIVAHARPSADSDIVIEVWLPVSGWNGKLQGMGNGGFAGFIDYGELGASILKGYAAVATDTGHAGSPIDAAWALGHPEKVADFGHRGIHEMTRVAKLAVMQLYGTGAKRSYFAGCSDGGREALMEAQRYPEDYDGILAGAPANNWTDLLTMAVIDTQALTATPASFIPQAKIPAIAKAVVAACDGLDGVPDGILNDPRQCRFDPATIECKGDAESNECLSAAQVTALKQIYAGLKDVQGHSIFPGYLPGAEEGGGGWGLWITGPAPAKSLMAYFGNGYYADMVYGKTGWDYKSFALESGLRDAKEKTAAALDAVNPDLSAFRSRGGKLILFHGWNDPAIPARSTVEYYNNVVAKGGKEATNGFVRLYMLPGVQHCAGGPGADVIGLSGTWPDDPRRNVRTALEEWVEKGMAPGTLVASKTAGDTPQAAVTMTRLLCPFPELAKYKGSGDPNNAESYACTAARVVKR